VGYAMIAIIKMVYSFKIMVLISFIPGMIIFGNI